MRRPRGLGWLRLPSRRQPSRRGAAPARRALRDAPRFVLGTAPMREPRRRVPWGRIFGTAAALGLLAGSVYGAAWLLMGDSLRVRQVHIAGTQVTHPHAVAVTAALSGRSMLWLDLDEAAARIEALPAVKEARVARRWPQAVAIEVVEHQAWGYWQAGGRRLVVGEEGRVLEAARPAPAGAPTIVEVGPREAGEAATPDPDTVRLVARLTSDGTLERLRVTPSAYLFRRERGLTIVVEDGPDAVFGDSSNYGFKVATWREVLLRAGEQASAAREIDLRFGSRVVLR
jgi:cell division septal protein FtsQ